MSIFFSDNYYCTFFLFFISVKMVHDNAMWFQEFWFQCCFVVTNKPEGGNNISWTKGQDQCRIACPFWVIFFFFYVNIMRNEKVRVILFHKLNWIYRFNFTISFISFIFSRDIQNEILKVKILRHVDYFDFQQMILLLFWWKIKFLFTG